jgi:hypothetical protein
MNVTAGRSTTTSFTTCSELPNASSVVDRSSSDGDDELPRSTIGSRLISGAVPAFGQDSIEHPFVSSNTTPPIGRSDRHDLHRVLLDGMVHPDPGIATGTADSTCRTMVGRRDPGSTAPRG